ncbi:hypothetical protein GTY65_24525 [Streptomyces sp. SID8379]|uniref:hypothetical protein n=1 Tax=Streptomyces sp. SID8379 TaxID=2690359 RepID=UPI001370351C|nr:hypothetical protein [Streptomyces sp. SID8379]MYW67208.1 hypothetical protein [Streptomyces sp. SID8379]
MAYTTPWCLITALMGAIVFNVMVALLSGLFFWENIGIALTIGLTVLCHPQDFSTAFGIAPCGLSIGILLLAISKWSWKPTGLGWWDTPYTSRVYWTAVTRSGLVVGLYNNHFSPHDREYGRDLGNYLTTEPVVTFSMGGVEDSSLKDLLLDMRIHGRDLLDIKDEYGQSKWRADFVRGHIQYMRNLIRGLNSGTRKNPLPEGLRWLRAPGGHLYYWGPLPRYERKKHGAINAVRVNQREIFFVTSECSWVVLRDELLFQIDTSE